MKSERRLIRPVSLVSALIALTACDCSETEAAEPSECEARISLFAERMTDVGRGSNALPTTVELPRLEAGEVLHAIRPSITIHVDHVSMDGRDGSEDELLADLDTLERNWSILHPQDPDPPPPLVLADARAEVATRYDLLSRVAGQRPFQLVVHGSSMRDPLPYDGTPEHVSPFIERFRSTHDLGDQATLLSEMWTDALTTCPPAIRGFGELSTVPTDERHERATEIMAAAFATCRCRGVDVDMVETAMALSSLWRDREQRVLSPLLSPADDASIALPEGATFDHLAAAVAESDQASVWFRPWQVTEAP